MTSRPQAAAPRSALVRSVALPSEHGGWSFLLEPIALGLAVAPSLAGLLLGVAVTGTFLAHQPLKTAIKDWRAGRRAPRTAWAWRFAAGYAAVALTAFAAALVMAGWRSAIPLVAALPFAAVQLAFDARNRSRALGAEVSGAVALGAVATAVAALGGSPPGLAAALWPLLVARSVPSILYVRKRLRLEHGKQASTAVPVAAHVAAVAAVAGLAAWGLAPWLAVAAAAGLLVRAALGLSRYRVGRRPAAIGAQEVLFGLLYVAAIAVGYGR